MIYIWKIVFQFYAYRSLYSDLIVIFAPLEIILHFDKGKDLVSYHIKLKFVLFYWQP